VAGAVLAAVAEADDGAARRARPGEPLLADLGNHAGNSCSPASEKYLGGYI
jgi:hypothetical protein